MRAEFAYAPELEQQLAESGKLYREFLRVPSMSAGLYVLAAGATDPQRPHHEDEMYYVVRGRAQFARARKTGKFPRAAFSSWPRRSNTVSTTSPKN